MSLRWRKPGAAPGPLAKAIRATPEIAWVAFVAALVVFLGSAALLVYNGLTMREVIEARETRLLEGGLKQKARQLKEEVISATVWSESYQHTAYGYDPEWAHINLGDYYHRYMRHDLTLGLDGADRAAYASIEGNAVSTDEAAVIGEGARDLVAKARELERAIVAKTPEASAFDRLATASGAFQVGDHIYFGVASTIVREAGDPRPMAAKAPMLVSAVRLDGQFLAETGATFQIRNIRLLTAPPRNAPAVVIADAAKRPLGYISWAPYRPGLEVIYQNRYYIALLGAAIIGALFILLSRISRMAQSLVGAKEEAEAADLAKSAFLANMSHEIRTPLNGVLGMAQVMEADELSPRQRERVKVIRDSGAALLAILNDLLDLSKVQAGRLQFEDKAFNISTVVGAVQSAFEDLARDQGSSLVCDIAPDALGGWSGDALRIRQILTNLVSNAVKFTAGGQVTIRVATTADGLRFEICDTGVGIDAAHLARVFEKFSQEDVSTTRRYGGTGLGLSICRELVTRMGGEISVTSEKGKGSVFTFDLPLRRARLSPAGTEAPVEAMPDRRLRILAAEDNPTNQLVLRSLLEPLGAEIILAGNGRIAVEAFLAGQFDVILMDVQMPEMNGVEAAIAIRQIERRTGRPPTPILALSANVMDHQVRDYLAAGMNGWVAKPIVLETLYEALAQTLLAADGSEDAAA